VLVPVRVWFGPPLVDGEELDRSPRWQCLVRGETTARAVLYGDDTPVQVEGLFLFGLERITEERYRYMVGHAAWATGADPKHPEAQPTTPIDWNALPPVFKR
jgi:hypothetical protein